MNIATKIRINCLFMVALVLLTGILGHREVTRIGNAFDHAISRTQAVVNALQDIRFQTMRLTALAHGHREGADVPPGNQASTAVNGAAYLPAATALRLAGERHLDLVSRFFPGEVKYADPIRDAITDLRAIAREMEERSADDATGQRDALERIEAATNKLLAVTERSLAAEAEELRGQQLEVEVAMTRYRQAILAGTALVVFGGLLVSAYASRRLSRPIAALHELAAGLGAGKLDLRAPAHDRDDMGKLAHAFNDMAHALGRTMVFRQHVDSIIDCVADGVLVTDRAGLVQRANQAARGLLAGAGGPLIGTPVAELLPDAAAWLSELLAAPAAATREIDLPGADASPRRVQLRAAPMRDGAKAVGLVLTLSEN